MRLYPSDQTLLSAQGFIDVLTCKGNANNLEYIIRNRSLIKVTNVTFYVYCVLCLSSVRYVVSQARPFFRAGRSYKRLH